MTRLDAKTTFYVATLGAYVLVDAENEQVARSLGEVPLRELYRKSRMGLSAGAPINIRTVRPATPDEIKLQRYHDEAVAAEAICQNS